MKLKGLLVLLICSLPGISISQIVPIGNGSYTTQLPPRDAAGRNDAPIGTPRRSGAALSKPVNTNDWWSGLNTFNEANLYNYPLSLKGTQSGLILSYTFLGLGAIDSRQPMGPEQPIILSVTGIANYPTVADYSDWTVKANWTTTTHTFDATIGMGMPFVYCTKGSADVASVTINIGTATIQNEMILVTNSISSANFAIYAPIGSTWIKTGNVYTSSLAGKNYFSAALLPAGFDVNTTAASFKQYAYVFPTNTKVDYTYNQNSSLVNTTMSVTTDVKEGSGTTVLLGVLPHQWAHLNPSSPQPGSITYNTSRGLMKMLASNTFVVTNKFKGILSSLPNAAKYSNTYTPSALKEKTELMKGTAIDTWTDSYVDGMIMNKIIQVAKIAEQTGDTALRDELINTVRIRLENWLKAESGENAFLFYYSNQWNTLIGYPAGYSSDAHLNDHHFHYGYFIGAAAAIEQMQPGWANQWGDMLNLLVKDVANWDRTNLQFPYLRNFNPYAGHSFAAGILDNEPHGNNQESSSEAMNFNANLILWGQLTNNTSIRNLGIYLYTTEETAIEEYYFDVFNRNFSANYSPILSSRIWSDGYDRGTFWTNDIAASYGIEMFPITAASYYLNYNPSYSTTLWNNMKANTGVLSNAANVNLWYEVYYSYLSLFDASTAINLYNSNPNYQPKVGCTDAQTYHFLHTNFGLGTADPSITADYPIAMVFNKSGDKTYVAHNFGLQPLVVNFSDGYVLTVPAKRLKTSKDLGLSGQLICSVDEIRSTDSVLLATKVSGGSVTRVDYYDGSTLLGSSTIAPYSFYAKNLSTKVHYIYAKIYSGQNFELSNAIKLIVGIQYPYLLHTTLIPSESIQPGNYDFYEGGVGQGITYNDRTVENSAGTFRSPEYVDAVFVNNEGNILKYIDAGEWTEHTVNIANSGVYDLSIRYNSGNSAGGGPLRIELDNDTIVKNIKFNFTDAAWTNWSNKLVTGIEIPQGKHIMKLVFENGGMNLGKLTFTYKSPLTVQQVKTENAISIFPNPCIDYIQLTNVEDTDVYFLYDLQGKIIASNYCTTSTIDVRNLANGTYVLKIVSTKGVQSKLFNKISY